MMNNYLMTAGVHIGFEAEDATPETYENIVREACARAWVALQKGSPHAQGPYANTKLRFTAPYAVLRAAIYQEDHELVNAGKGSDPADDGSIITTASYIDNIPPVDFTAITGAGFEHPSKGAVLLQGHKHTRLREPESIEFYRRVVAEPEHTELLTKIKERGLAESKITGKEGTTGTAGAIAYDRDGHMAALGTTGGLMAVKPGRESDIFTTGAVYGWENKITERMMFAAVTGRGENTSTAGFAQSAVDNYTSKRSQITAEEAVWDAFEKLERTNEKRAPEWRGEAGMIAIAVQGKKVDVVTMSNFEDTDKKYFMCAHADPATGQIITFLDRPPIKYRP